MSSLSWAEAAARSFEPPAPRWSTPGDLAQQIDPRIVQTPALDLMDAALVEAFNTPDGRLIWAMPPQEGKSDRTMKFIVWALTQNPDLRIINASYAQGLANRNGRTIRNTILGHPELGLQIAPDNGAAHEWQIAGHDGGVLAVGRGAGATGRPCDLLVIDDPIKDRKEADSEIIRQACVDWWTDVLSTRLAPGATVILIQCMTGDTPVLLPDGTDRLLRDIRPGDEVATYEGGGLSKSTVVNWVNHGPDAVFCIRMRSGRVVKANARHPFLTIDANGNEVWLRTDQIQPGANILTAIGESGAASPARLTNATCRPAARECATRTTTKSAGRLDIGRLRSMLQPGAGLTSSIGTDLLTKRSTFSSTPRTVPAPSVENRRRALTPEPTGMGSCASITTTTLAGYEGCCVTTATSRSATESRPASSAPLLTTWRVTPDEVVEVEPCGREDVFDLQVDRTENFIANGLVSHNTRWHESDLAGYLQSAPDGRLWRTVNVPAQADHDPNKAETDPLGREPGAFMRSARRRTLAQWEAIKIRVGSRTWNALYQGRPSPAEGGIFKRDSWKTYDVPMWIDRDDGTKVTTAFDLVIQSWDMAFKDTKSSDYVVGQVWGRRGIDLYLLDQVRGRFDFPETCRQVQLLSAKWPDAVLKVVEDKANGTAVLASLRRTIPGLVAETPTESKTARAQAAAPLQEAGNVWLPDPQLAPWIGDFMEECAAFPNGTHDDQVDGFSQAAKRMILIPLLEGSDPDDDPGSYDDYDEYGLTSLSAI